MVKPLFELGEVVATANLLNRIDNQAELAVLLNRHVTGDWGDTCKEDAEMNDVAINRAEGVDKKEDRVFSVHHTADGTTVWIITEWDRSYTTLLLPEDY